MTTPTVAERIDPQSAHYDAAFAAMRKSAFNAFTDHKADMRNSAEYRKVARKNEKLYK